MRGVQRNTSLRVLLLSRLFFSGIASGMRTGNVALYNAAMEEHREYYIQVCYFPLLGVRVSVEGLFYVFE